jgi:aspartate racemase
MKTLGIVMHSAEGGTLCLLTACREGQSRLGPHLHPTIVTSAIPMGLSMPLWEANDYDGVGKWLRLGVEQVAAAGADFFVCPDNTAHIALERIADSLPIPGLHIADVVCHAIKAKGLRTPAVLGTKWTMTGPVYTKALERHGFARLVPGAGDQQEINRAIFDELCQGKFPPSTTERFVQVIGELKTRGADCVILGCTEIPLIITEENSPLPVLDSTRLLAQYAVGVAIDPAPLNSTGGWLAMGANYP